MINLERGKAFRIAAQFLRDEKRMSSDDANRAAEQLCDRLTAATPPSPVQTPLKPRTIGARVAETRGTSYQRAVMAAVPGITAEQAIAVWKVVYEHCSVHTPSEDGRQS